jgi:hypothetical protein
VSSWTIIFRASFIALAFSSSAYAQDSIQVQSLDALDPLEVGLPDTSLPPSLWDGTHAAMAGRVIAALPDAMGDGYQSPFTGELVRAVLSTGGHPPQGGRGDLQLAVLRTDRLLAAAGVHDVYDLLERTPNINQNTEMSYWHAELAFAVGDLPRACRTANALLEGREQAYWLRARAFCLGLNGQGAAAELTAELARSETSDPEFDTLLFALTLGGELDGSIAPISSGLKLAMTRHLVGPGRVVGHIADSAPGWLHRLDLGPVGETLTEGDDPQTLLALAEAESGMARTALLETVLSQGRDREAAALALGQLLDDDADGGDFVEAAVRYGREIQSLPITRTTLQHGYRIALAALIIDDRRLGMRWRNALRDGPAPSRATTPMLSGPGGAVKPDGETLMVESVPEWVPPSASEMISLNLAIAVAQDRLRGGEVHALLGAYLEVHGDASLPDILALTRLGASMPRDMRLDLLEAPAATTPSSVFAMEAAARSGAKAEAALLGALSLMPTDTPQSTDTLSRVVKVLDSIDMRGAALGLVLERLVVRAL